MKKIISRLLTCLTLFRAIIWVFPPPPKLPGAASSTQLQVVAIDICIILQNSSLLLQYIITNILLAVVVWC